MEKSIEFLNNQLRGIRTSRASPALLEGIRVEYYGTPSPIQQVAAITTPDPKTIMIKPFDASTLNAIQKAIMNANIGLTPQNDGKVIRITMPPMSEERRRQYADQAKKIGEEAKVSVRNVRRDVLKIIEQREKEKKLSEDQKFRAKEEVQKLTEKYEKRIDEIVSKKQKEIMEG